MPTAPILIRSPVLVPTSANPGCLSSYITALKMFSADSSLAFATNYDAFEVSKRLQIQLRQIPSTLITMEGAIEIRPGVCDHLDLTDVKLSSRRVVLSGIFARHV